MALIAMKSVPGHPPGNLGNTGCPGLPVEGIGANYLAFIELASIRRKLSGLPETAEKWARTRHDLAQK